LVLADLVGARGSLLYAPQGQRGYRMAFQVGAPRA
jgi:hypothetical protein